MVFVSKSCNATCLYLWWCVRTHRLLGDTAVPCRAGYRHQQGGFREDIAEVWHSSTINSVALLLSISCLTLWSVNVKVYLSVSPFIPLSSVWTLMGPWWWIGMSGGNTSCSSQPRTWRRSFATGSTRRYGTHSCVPQWAAASLYSPLVLHVMDFQQQFETTRLSNTIRSQHCNLFPWAPSSNTSAINNLAGGLLLSAGHVRMKRRSNMRFAVLSLNLLHNYFVTAHVYLSCRWLLEATFQPAGMTSLALHP